MADDLENQTKEQLLKRISSHTKEELADALAGQVKKDDLVGMLSSLKKEELVQIAERQAEEGQGDRESGSQGSGSGRQESSQQRDGDDTDLDWNAELDWSAPPAPTPAPVSYSGAAPFMPGQRVRVDVSGLPMMGIFAGKGASAAGTITGVDARSREVKVYLDAVFDGEKEIVVPPERITPDG
jgi:ribosomal protein L21E